MNNPLDDSRARQLNLDGFPPRSQITFCPRCSFQYDYGELGPRHCPDCGIALWVTTLTPELLRLHAGPAPTSGPSDVPTKR